MRFLLPRVRGSGKRTGGHVNLIRVLFAALALLVFAPAHAAVPKGPGDCSSNSPIPAGTVVAGCGDFGPSNAKFTIQVSNSDATTTWCVGGPVCNQVGFQQTHAWNTVSLCPSGSTPNAQGTCDCSAGYIEQGGQCVSQSAHCQDGAGQVSTMNVTLGWARSPLPNRQDHIGQIRMPSRVCAPVSGAGSCSYSILDNSNQYRSQTPSAQGLYRISADVIVVQSDQTCSATDDAVSVNPDTPDMTCPGSVGTLDGKPYCAIDPGTTGVEPVGKPGVGTMTDDKGNPSAGAKPSTGEGSGTGGVGRTPATGNGGNSGGPASASSGGTGLKPGQAPPDGTTAKPADGKEQAACGAPGQPKCGIDETGTPSGKGDFDGANRGADETRDGWLAEIAKAKDLTSDGWTWTFQLPSGCTPLELPAYNMSLDVCRFQPVIHDIMSMVWLICTVMGCVWMVFNAQKN